MNTKPEAGEVWLAGLEMIGKRRPVLVLAYPQVDDARALTVVTPLTSQIKCMRDEVNLGHPNGYPSPRQLMFRDLRVLIDINSHGDLEN